MRTLAACAFAAIVAFLTVPAGAEETATPAPAAEAAPAGRFTMVPADGGFVRLDTRTGVVSHCRRESSDSAAPWRCTAISESVLNTPDRLTELGEEVEALSREVAALRMRVDELQRHPEPPPAPNLSSDEEMNRALDFSEELMRRFLGLVREMKHDQAEDRT